MFLIFFIDDSFTDVFIEIFSLVAFCFHISYSEVKMFLLEKRIEQVLLKFYEYFK